MKTLNEYINESLLDDLDSLEAASDAAMTTESPDFINAFGAGWALKDNTLISPSHDVWKHNNKFRGYAAIDLTRANDDAKQIFGAVDTIDINFNSCFIKNKDRLSPRNFCKNIAHKGKTSLTIECHEIKDINISSYGHEVIFSHYLKDVALNNVNIIFNDEKKRKLLYIANEKFPTFKNVKSNASEIKIYDCFIFDDTKTINDINNLLDLPYTVKIYDNVKNIVADIPIKTFKKIHSIVNNKKRYNLLEPLFKPKPNIKINDLFDVSGFSNLRDILISNNLVSIKLSKSGKDLPINGIMDFKIGDWYGVLCKKS